MFEKKQKQKLNENLSKSKIHIFINISISLKRPIFVFNFKRVLQGKEFNICLQKLWDIFVRFNTLSQLQRDIGNTV